MGKVDKGFDYAAKFAELEEVLDELQDTNTPLDEAIRLHEKGKKLVAELEDYLKGAEVVINKQLAGDD